MKRLLLIAVLALALHAQTPDEPKPDPAKHYAICVDTKSDSYCSRELFTQEDALKVARMFGSFPLVSEPVTVRVIDADPNRKRA